MNELIHPNQLQGHTAAVVGAGRSGLAAARLLHALGAGVRLLERSPELSEEARRLVDALGFEVIHGRHAQEHFRNLDMVVLSPGVPRRSIEPLLPSQPVQVLAELELASWFVNRPMVAVTGSNGKTTTTTVIGHVLSRSDRSIFVGGNIGTPLSEYILDGPQADILVLEVSSFQLQNVSSFHPRVGVLLNFSPNHLDYHETLDEYLEAKLRLFVRQDDQDLAVLPFQMKEMLEEREFTGARKVYFVPTERFDCPALPGEHNRSNLEAAWHVCRFFGVEEEQMQQALRSFKGLPHRLERVGEKDGVLYVDDSKATTLEALQAALRSFDRPVHLLAGGVFKGGDPRLVASLIKDKVKSVALFGQGREVFEPAWKDESEVTWDATLEEAVARVKTRALKGDVVLLSPATASFDLFANYRERGLAFRRAAGLE